MTNDDQHGMEQPDDPVDRIRRALKNLPPVNAAPDFDARLQRRLGEPERREEDARWWQKIFTPARMPAFGYSLMALVAVGFVSYYMFWRSGMAPEGAQEGTTEGVPAVTGRVSPAPPQLLKQGEPAQKPEENKLQTAGSAVREEKRSIQPGQSGQSDERQLQVRKDKKAPSVKNDRLEVESEKRLEDDSRSKIGYGDAAKAAAQAPRNEMSAPAPTVQMQQNTPSQAKKAGPLAPQMHRQQVLPSTTYDLKKAEDIRLLSPAAATVVAIDSAAIRDSLRIDSLRKAKAKKPPG